MSAKKTDKSGSFWTTLPGIITAITGLIVAVGGLVTILGDEGILNRLGIERLGSVTPTTQVNTPDDLDDPDPLNTPVPTRDPELPDCTYSLSYEEIIEGYDGVILAWSEEELWVRVSELEEDVFNRDDVTARRFPYKYGVPECLADYIKALSADRQVHWPVAESSAGRVYSEVWLQRSTNFKTGLLKHFPAVPDMILITVSSGEDKFAQVYHCGVDIPWEDVYRVGYWYAATDEAALAKYMSQYEDYKYEIRPTVPCQ